MKPMRPTSNVLTGGYSSKHKGYDFDDLPDNRCYAVKDGVVEKSVFKYSRAWLQGKIGDPSPGLTTEDYGNYLIIRHHDGTYALYAHLDPNGKQLTVGTSVIRGKHIATIGHTGNSTGAHLHFEYRNSNNQSISTDFEPLQLVIQAKEQEKESMTVVEFTQKMGVKDLKEAYEVHTREIGFLADARKNLQTTEGKLRDVAIYVADINDVLETKTTPGLSLQENMQAILQKSQILKTQVKSLADQVASLQSTHPQNNPQVDTSNKSSDLLKRLTSRKLWIAVLAAFLPIINEKFGINLDPELVLTAVFALMGYVGLEGIRDVAEATK